MGVPMVSRFLVLVVANVRDRHDLHFSVLLATIGRSDTIVVSQEKKETHPNPPSYLAITSASRGFSFLFSFV